VARGGPVGAGLFCIASLVFVGCGSKLMPSSAKNAMKDARIPFSIEVRAKLRSAFTIWSSGEFALIDAFCESTVPPHKMEKRISLISFTLRILLPGVLR
jgi:hypothetical protein